MTGTGLVSILAIALNALAILVAWWCDLADTLKALLVAAGVNGTTAVGYWLGSSAGSRAKDEIIARGSQQ